MNLETICVSPSSVFALPVENNGAENRRRIMSFGGLKARHSARGLTSQIARSIYPIL